MRKQIFFSCSSVVGTVLLTGLSTCSSTNSNNAGQPTIASGGSQSGTGGSQTSTGGSQTSTGGSQTSTGGSQTSAGGSQPGAAGSQAAAGCTASDPNSTYILIDDMEKTSHGPIQFGAGISAPLAAGYWYNSGASWSSDAGADTSDPPQLKFEFTALPAPTTTFNCSKASAHAARQTCVLNGLYDTCGVGFEFAQVPDTDAGAPTDTSASDAGDAGASIPMVTVPFDISGYKALTFWGMTTTPDATKGSMQVKVSFPDTDTDPRGQVCNGGGGNTSKCYNSYASYLNFTTSWQQFTVLLDAGKDGVPPTGGIAIDQTWGYLGAQWIPTQVYGINWQAQRNIGPTEGPPLKTEIWVDDVYFVK